MNRNQSMVAVGLEVGPGLFQTFGLGHMYAGRWGTGLLIMLSYWVMVWINSMLVPFFGLGILTGGLTWLAYMVACPTNLLESKAR